MSRRAVRTGFGDEHVLGLTSKSYNEDPPPGWKIGYGKREHGFFEPRATPSKGHSKAVCEAAQALIASLEAAKPKLRHEAHERFGTPTFHLFGSGRVISPGFELLGEVLWLTFGDHDFEAPKENHGEEGKPSMVTYFTPAKRSEYYAAREAAGIEEDDD